MLALACTVYVQRWYVKIFGERLSRFYNWPIGSVIHRSEQKATGPMAAGQILATGYERSIYCWKAQQPACGLANLNKEIVDECLLMLLFTVFYDTRWLLFLKHH